MRSRLRHSEQLATLGALAANIAHEMNQPLAVIALASENALRLMNLPDSSLPRITAKLEQIHIQVMRLSQVINSIRQFSRNEQSHMSEFTVKSVIDDALNLAEARIKSTGVTIGLQLPDNLPVLCMDRLLLERVLLNLIANACDAYGEQTSRALTHALDVIVSATLRESCLAIFVSDHAGGISTDLLDRLFDPFVTTKSGATGTGLGLSICAANIAELGGEITARNADGGAVFEIILPLESSVINV
jgi:C4-dicarboxylate-specific signal transduction histidine kinase